jgi:hypothetical protein
MTNAAEVMVEIVDLLGRKVSKVMVGRLKAGADKFSLSTANLAAGTYRCVARTGGLREETQLVVVH